MAQIKVLVLSRQSTKCTWIFFSNVFFRKRKRKADINFLLLYPVSSSICLDDSDMFIVHVCFSEELPFGKDQLQHLLAVQHVALDLSPTKESVIDLVIPDP